MESESIHVLFGAILLVLVINTTFMWAVLFSMQKEDFLQTNGQAGPLAGGDPVTERTGAGRTYTPGTVPLAGVPVQAPANSTGTKGTGQRSGSTAPAGNVPTGIPDAGIPDALTVPDPGSDDTAPAVQQIPVISNLNFLTASSHAAAPAGTSLNAPAPAVAPAASRSALAARNTGAVIADTPLTVNTAAPLPTRASVLPPAGPAINAGTVIADAPLAVKPAATRVPERQSLSFVSIDMPEPEKRGTQAVLGHEFTQRKLGSNVPVYTLVNQSLPARIPVVSVNLVEPPLVIDYQVFPLSITDLKYVEYRTGKVMHNETLHVHRFYEDSWFRITVRDRDTGEIVDVDGAGREFSLDEKPRQFVVWPCGNYSISFEGEDATVSLAVRVMKEMAPSS